MAKEFIDLGLPSGNLWATENEVAENGQPLYATFDEAVNQYGENLPTKDDWQELLDNVPYVWDKKRNGLLFVARNGAEVFLPATGYRSIDGTDFPYGGYCWSATKKDWDGVYVISFLNDVAYGTKYAKMNLTLRGFWFPVRLIKKGGKQ